MEGGSKRDFPTGSSGGGGKRGYGVKPSHLFPYGIDNALANTSGESSQKIKTTTTGHKGSPNNEDKVQLDTQDKGARDTSEVSPSDQKTQGDSELKDNAEEKEDKDDQFNIDADRDNNERDELVRHERYEGFMQGEFPDDEYLDEQLLPEEGFLLRFNVFKAIRYNGIMAIDDGYADMGIDFIVEDIIENGWQNALYIIECSHINTINLINTGNLVYYIQTTTDAFRYLNATLFCDMLCLRDAHIFAVVNSTNYIELILEICNNVNLSEAIINHIQCVQALMNRNLTLACIKQARVVNAILRLVYEPHLMQEPWTRRLIHSVKKDLRILSEKAASSSNDGLIMHMGWALNDFVSYCDNPRCYCRRPHVFGASRFYRRA